MRNKLAVAAGSITWLWAASTLAASVTFNTFVGSTGGAPIGFTYAGNKFVGSNYFNNQLYQTDLNGLNVQAFGAPIPIDSGSIGEIYVSSSLGLGGFGSSASRDVFAGSQAAGDIYRFSNNGSTQSLFASGLGGSIRGIAFDPYGNYGNQMLVTTSLGNVYKVNSLGVPTLLANVGGDAEGLDFTPQAFGNIPAHTLVVVSEGTGRLNAIDSSGGKTDLGLGFATPEMLSFIPLNLGASGNPLEGFYAANYSVNVVKAEAGDFSPYKGDAVITDEGNHNMYHISWDALNSKFVATVIGQLPNQPEDGIFVTATVLNPVPEPETYAMMLAGLGLLGFAARRRKQKEAA